MTEKRFIVDDDGIVTDMLDLSMYIDEDDCCEKLNELAEENMMLKGEVAHYKLILMSLEKEAKRLSQIR